ncbi:MAG TPA: nitrate- and nitrite sensing domain-containing protein [Streptosporangiaceae bacterium]|nr:nitrate- and nitrite sensing domain-containing protein [Streptosporangiaceae bacterium]
MGNHGGASTRLRASEETERAKTSMDFHPLSSQAFTLRNWPVSWRLFAVIMLTLAMGLVFGGLRVAGAADSAAQFNRVSQLANLGQQITVLTQALANERDKTCGGVSNARAMLPLYSATDTAAAKVRTLAEGIGGSFSADIQAKANTVRSEIASLGHLRATAQGCPSALLVLADYAVPINDMMALNGQIAQGANDPALTNDVQTLNSLSQEKDQVSQQRAILYDAFNKGTFANAEREALVTAVAGQGAAATAFDATATPAEQDAFTRIVSGDLVKRAVSIETYVLSTGRLDVGNAAAVGVSTKNAPSQWYKSMSDTIDRMQTVELGVAGNIVARAQVLQRGAERSALFIGILTAAILILVLLATFVVARSLVQPLRRLREGALDIATVQLPERVRQLDESQDPDPSLEVAPIDVLSVDEIGQVARAFDQVHTEAVRLAGNEALLRRSFNAMFVSLSRRSQSLIERLVRMIDSLEQNEEDPGRLSNLFAMDHLVTRMRRNSENLLLLAGHEGARKWSEPVPLTDVARAAISEIEQYNRVALKIQPGVMVTGHAVSDVVHLLAELIENATVFSASDTRVLVSVQELASGGVLIQISDSGVGVSDTRLAEMNRRLDDPPPIDESISRHMGLYAVARLAERHGVRVRLRAGNPQGLTALVWLPDNVAERGGRQYGDVPQRLAAFEARRTPGQHATEPAAARPAVPSFTGPSRVLQPAGQDAGPASAAWFLNRQAAGIEAAGIEAAGASPPPQSPWPAAPRPEGAWPAAPDGWASGQQAAQTVANPVRGDRTVAGMPVRVPHANLVPGSADGQRGASQPVASPGAASSGLPQRSAETARSRLSGFQRGARRAEDQASHAQASHAEMRTDR